jgi:alcohol dehydrogenase class IV
MTFEFATAQRVVFGRGKARQVPAMARGLGRCALVVLGGSGRGADALRDALNGAGVAPVVCNVSGEPTTHLVDELTRLARERGCDVVISQGGGSVIDAGKAVAAMIANPGEVSDYLELGGGGKSLAGPGEPFIAVPTTAGTGSEVSRNAVLDVPKSKVKISLRSPHLLARLAVVDPELTLSLPPAITASTGMDALTQLIEPFVSTLANPVTDGLCREGLMRAARSLASAHRDGSDLSAREDMAIAALLSGIALANAKLGAVHGFASVLGGITGYAHGVLCASLLPFVMEANIRALEERGDPAIVDRYTEIARVLTGDPGAAARDGASWVRGLAVEMRIPGLRESGLSMSDCSRVIPLAQGASSMQGNPLKLTDDELLAIVEAAY